MIEFKNVDVIFGKQSERAIPLLDQGVSRNQILEDTGLTSVSYTHLTLPTKA